MPGSGAPGGPPAGVVRVLCGGKEPLVDGNKIAQSYMVLYFGEVAAALASLDRVLGRKARFDDVEPATWLLGMLGKVTSSCEFALAIREWDVAAFQMEAF